MPGKRVSSGTIGSVKAALCTVICYNRGVVEDATKDDEIRQKASNCLVQAALAWAKLFETYDLQQGMHELERLAQSNGNGHAA